MGFDAIWISPIPHNAEADYHGYGALDWEKVNEHFGTEDELKELVKACHDRDIWVMLDVVANHSSYFANADFSNVNPLNKPEYYHTNCDIDFDDQWSVENCWLSGLPDLDQSNDFVRSYLKKWIKETVSRFDFDGIRIDTVPHVPKDFWTEYGEAAGVFQMGEAFNGDPNYVGDYQNYLTALFNYPMFFSTRDVYGGSQSMYNLRTRYDEEANSTIVNIDVLGSFMDNHDNARFLSVYPGRDNGFKNAVCFALTARGIPFFYYGDEQMFSGGNDPANRESLWDAMDTGSDMYKFVATINQARQSAEGWAHDYVERYVLDDFFAYSFGDMLVLTTNSDRHIELTLPYLPYASGTEVCNVFDSSDCDTVDDDGLDISFESLPKIYLPKGSEFFARAEADSAIKIETV
uniref:alpha-amylase n=1 Tax=Favella ehrenbergii TaxID=182087 RepID=A0A7S3MMW5_9SPIT|mmetsp:Transcript_31321/g.38777  ORF Transcript_31321/g.38777 Transcript_31321/m.38777 type:complete len:405 (+) Transcript_31321:219-1433(+)|eukprot:CAMPEP_0170461466 /NCGR_PEP_ID=MMETSP0123-20130129/7359_1 /TAXON_ID=182087 /ORGANISM="Favella ehrenbergii, Strain Fehren 1" /LENGTH=404 /DNA_ID=CAMNT_0010726489 /DNA_START=219 /DNA_END=1433 /DNA_ORIENTATION=-